VVVLVSCVLTFRSCRLPGKAWTANLDFGIMPLYNSGDGPWRTQALITASLRASSSDLWNLVVKARFPSAKSVT